MTSPLRIARGLRATIREPGDIVLALRMGYFLWRAPHALGRTHVHDYLAGLERSRSRPRRSNEAQLERIFRIRWVWLRMPFFRNRDSCYLRSLTLYRFLEAGPDPIGLHFGVEERRDPRDRRRAHVWISLGERTFEGPPETAVPIREVTLSQAFS